MIILHSMPKGIVWSNVDFMGTDPAALTKSKPASATRIEFVSASMFDTRELRASWPAAKVIGGMRVIFDRGIRPNTVVRAYGWRAGDANYDFPLGGNSGSALTVQRPDGEVSVTFLFDATEPLNGVSLVVYNQWRPTPETAEPYIAGYFDIGEIFFGEREEWCIRPTPSVRTDDPSLFEQTLGNQPHVVRRQSSESISVEITPVSFDTAYMAQQSFQRLKAKLIGKQDCVMIFATRQPHTGPGPIDYDVVQQDALFGKCSEIGEMRPVDNGNSWVLPLTFRQSPGRLIE